MGIESNCDGYRSIEKIKKIARAYELLVDVHTQVLVTGRGWQPCRLSDQPLKCETQTKKKL